MNRFNFLVGACLIAVAPLMQSCDTDCDDDQLLMLPTAVVTVCPQSDESVILQLTDEDQLVPVNLSKSPFGKKEVRALVNYSPVADGTKATIAKVNVNWIDSIRTKMPVEFDPSDVKKYGNDPLEIVDDWVTVAEDGYLTLRVRTVWGLTNTPHVLTLTYGQNKEDAMEFKLHQNSDGDIYGNMGDALIAFNLNQFIANKPAPSKIRLKWNSFSGEKTAEFTFNTNRHPTSNADSRGLNLNNVE